jgi:site-specific recombinase XerD
MTINTYARSIRAFWGWLEREGLIKENPLKAVPAPRKPHLLPKAFTEEEVLKILRIANSRVRDRAMVQLFLDSGIRLSECLGLTLHDVDLKQGRLRVYGKGNKERYAYFSNRTAESLRQYIKEVRPPAGEDENLFLNKDGTPMDKRRVQTILHIIGEKAGLKYRLSPHKLRHTFATLSLKYGNNLEYLRLALGHSDIKTTSNSYLAASDADVARAQRRSSPMANIYR